MEDLVENFYQFWKKKRVLITGNSGFKGSWLTLFLKQFDADICGYSLEPDFKPNYFDYLNKKDKQRIQDINNFNELDKTIKNFRPQLIFHLAAQAIVSKSYEQPYNTFVTNTLGTLNLLEVIRKYPPKVFINITSDKCYINNDHVNKPLKENAPLGGDDPYSASKACSEIITNAYLKSFFLKNKKISISTVRAGNVIGGGDWSKDRLIPDIIRSIQNNKILKIRNIHSTRPWQHVLDITNNYLILAIKMYKNNKYSDCWNFGPNRKFQSKSVLSILKIAKNNFHNLKIKEIKSSFSEKKYLILDTSKSIKLLGLKNKYDFEKSINKTFDWYKNFLLDKNSAYETSIKQIKDYINNEK